MLRLNRLLLIFSVVIASSLATTKSFAHHDQAEPLPLQDVVNIYCAAWGEQNIRERTEMLEQVWAEDGTYTDPLVDLGNRKKLIKHLSDFQRDFPGAQIVVSSNIDSHHDVFRFEWKMVLADGSVFLVGYDFGELDKKGRIKKINGFFGPLSPL